MIFPIVRLHAACICFFETCFFVNTSCFAFKCQQFSHSSVPGTYTLGVRRTPNQTDSDVTFSRSCDQGIIKKELKDNYGRFNWFYEPHFKTVLFEFAWFSWLFAASLVLPLHFLMWRPWVCASTAAQLCLKNVHHFELRH